MKSLERNMSRNLARLKYSTPAVLVAVACMAALILCRGRDGPIQGEVGRAVSSGAVSERRAGGIGASCREICPIEPVALGQRCPVGGHPGRGEIGAVGPVALGERLAVSAGAICRVGSGYGDERLAGGCGVCRAIGDARADRRAEQLRS